MQQMLAAAIGALMLFGMAPPSRAQTPRPPNGFALKAPSTPAEIEAAKPDPQAPGFRIPFPPLDEMDPAMRRSFEGLAKTFHTPVGNTAPLLLTPEVAAANSLMRPALEKSALPQDLFELTVLMSARAFDSQFEWWIHGPQGPFVGIPADTVEAIRVGGKPKFANAGQEATYHFLAELLLDHEVSDATYERLRAIIGTRQMVEMTVLAGYYTIAAMTLAAHNVPLRADVKPPLPKLRKKFP
jgi:4-carboxymuconolactone decarboxylase